MLLAAVLSIFVLAAVSPFLFRIAGRWTGWVLALLPAALTVSFFAHLPDIRDGETFRLAFEWVPTLGINLSLHLDGLALLFSVLICGIGAFILIYSGGYLAGHPRHGRFFAIMLLFMGSMLGLVLADNVFTLFVFWELTSVSSYLLIGFDNERPPARRAALQALLVTSAGGMALMAGLVLLAQVGGTAEISELVELGDTVQADNLHLPILLLILAGAFTKSAQFPFHFWLPNAMEAPTPVSAYLHSATMVKAGVYLLMRLHPIFSGTDEWIWIVTSAGAITMVLGAYVAVLEVDLKRVLAYSTLSVLGLLTMLLGEGSVDAVKAAVVFLLAHALYKGALFLVAGAIDHETGARDVTLLGGLRRKMPITALAGILGAVSLAGLGPVFAFIGKELVLEAVFHAPEAAAVLTGATVLASGLLVAVAGIVGIRPFFGETRPTPKTPHEAPPSIWIGPIVLATIGLALAFIPGRLVSDLVSPAAAPILGFDEPISVTLWHGIGPPLLLSGVSLAIGSTLYLLLVWIKPVAARAAALSWWAAERWYDRGLAGLMSLAVWQTRVLQDGLLRHYLFIIIAAGVGLTGFVLQRRGFIGDLPDNDVRFYEVIVAVMILLGALTAVRATSRLAAIAGLGVVGYGIALIYLLFGAPDLAMTQVLVETLIVILFVLVFYHLPRYTPYSTTRSRLRDALVAIGAGVLMTTLILVAVSSRFHPAISDDLAQMAYPEAQGRNVVNVILVDFRALDTLGEIVVLALAAAGVYALLKLRPHRRDDQ